MPLYLAGEWADDTGAGEGMSSSSLSRMLDDIGEDVELFNTFFTHWIKACGKPISVIHDTTSISSYSNSSDDIEWGYNRDCEQLAQINIALVVAKNSRLPIWFRMVSGSVPDVASLKLTCKILKSLGLKEFSFSLDRGYFSRSNLIEMIGTTIGFTLGAPTSQTQANQLILSNKDALESIVSSFLFNGKRMRHVACNYIIENKKSENISVPGHLFLDLPRRELAAGRMEITLLELEQLAKENKFATKAKADSWINENTGKLSAFFKVEGNNKQWNIKRNIDEITKNISTAGVALILTSRPGLSAKEVLEDYRCRDIAEKVFDTLKNGIGVNRLSAISNFRLISIF
jgi:transposase